MAEYNPETLREFQFTLTVTARTDEVHKLTLQQGYTGEASQYEEAVERAVLSALKKAPLPFVSYQLDEK